MIVLESIIMLVSYIYKEAKPKPPEDGTNQCSVIFLPLFSRLFIIYNISKLLLHLLLHFPLGNVRLFNLIYSSFELSHPSYF